MSNLSTSSVLLGIYVVFNFIISYFITLNVWVGDYYRTSKVRCTIIRKWNVCKKIFYKLFLRLTAQLEFVRNEEEKRGRVIVRSHVNVLLVSDHRANKSFNWIFSKWKSWNQYIYTQFSSIEIQRIPFYFVLVISLNPSVPNETDVHSLTEFLTSSEPI